MSLKLKEENEVVSFERLMEDDSLIVDELALVDLNIRKEIFGVLDYFFSFLKKNENKKPIMDFFDVRSYV
jgi:hypothetical protein